MTERVLDGHRALVTGAAQGIGRAIALRLARAGAAVATIDLPGHAAQSALMAELDGIGDGHHAFAHDLADTGGLGQLVDRIWDAHGPLDILVNNAGISALERFNQISLERWRTIMAVNVDAPFFLAQRTAEHMIAAGLRGRIVNVSSKNGLVAEPGLAHYNASKGAVELMTQSLAIELGEQGITVNAIAPGVIDTGMAAGFDLDWDRFLPYYAEHIPLHGRAGRPEDCAEAVLYLVTAPGDYITGQHIVIDGGMLANQVPRMQFMAPYESTLPPAARGGARRPES
jgi:NAD(P)-dependent dehydrogenase (short-subunit alcohol dehydrogenase family)